MSQLRFDFSRRGLGTLSGYDLGSLTVTAPLGTHPTGTIRSEQLMMICVAIPDLIFGIRALERGARRRFEFIGTDSSFSLTFLRNGNKIVLSTGEKPLGEVTMGELLHAVSRGVRAFLDVPENRLSHEDAAHEDLHASLRALEEMLPEYG